MENEDGHIDSPFDDEIERDPMAGGRVSHDDHKAHRPENVPPVDGDAAASWQPYSNAPRCTFCQYELTGLDVGSNCPECGKPIWESNIQPPLSGMSIASMVCGITALPGCMMYGIPSIVLGILGIVFGEVAARQFKRGERGGQTKGFALTGRICGWIALTLSVVGWIVIIVAIM